MPGKKGKRGRRPKKKRPPGNNPQDRKLTERQAIYLAEETGLPVAEIAELNLGEIREKLEWYLDPKLLLFRKVCGRVVRRDPVTGELHPVPFATVHVMDTDCNVLFYAPEGYGYVWIYPGFCSREEIATVQTDECGYFCVWIPRWDIDRLLRWRRERICFPVLEPPRIIDILDDIFPIPEGPRLPIPLPDPPPDFSEIEIRREVETRLGAQVADRLANLAPERTFGAFKGAFEAALLEPAPPDVLPSPPLPGREQLKMAYQEVEGDERFEKIDFRTPLGPFKICLDIFVPEWQIFFDVPDITFRVTQTQAGGEVTIYDESFFDVRWDDTSVSDVTLEAWPNAEAVEFCGEDPGIDCEDEPAILNISEMPLDPVLPAGVRGYHDNTIGDATFGYGLRVNQPSPDGISGPTPGPTAGTAHAPYADRLNFYGCFHIGDSTHYRVVAAFEGGAQQPITNVTFPVLTTGSLLDYQTPDADGWYPIRNDLISSYQHLILPWPTQQSRFADGTYELVLQVGSGSPGSISVDTESDPYTFEVDNSRPTATFHQIRWWHEVDGPGTATVLGSICPVLERNPSKDVIVEVTWSASAAHLRNASANLRGCGGGHPTALPSLSDRRWWWQNSAVNTTGMKVARWRISSSLPAGCYTAALDAVSRAYNPAVPGASTSADWYVLETRRWVHPRKAISVVDV